MSDPTAAPRLAKLTLGATRIVVGFLFACHGASSVPGLFGTHTAPTRRIGAWPGW